MPNAAIKKHVELDEKQQILDRLGDLSDFEIASNEVLIAIYQRPEKTQGGIILTHNSLKEDIYQGKVGLVVKIGEECSFDFRDAYGDLAFNLNIELHDWVVVRPSDTWPLEINSDPNVIEKKDFVTCRLVRPRNIRARIKNPQSVW